MTVQTGASKRAVSRPSILETVKRIFRLAGHPQSRVATHELGRGLAHKTNHGVNFDYKSAGPVYIQISIVKVHFTSRLALAPSWVLTI